MPRPARSLVARSLVALARCPRAGAIARGVAAGLVATAAIAACDSDRACAGTGPALGGAYTPLQLRRAYQEPPLPAHWSSLEAARAAALGAGQTLYILDLYDDPHLAQELDEFSRSFGLPRCSATPIPVDAVLPLAAASPAAGCTLSRVHATASGSMRSTPPPYNAQWEAEAAADLEWAHASAPLARLIEVDSAPTDWPGALALINRLGPGVVSMSMVIAEGAGSLAGARADLFDDAAMTYLAGTGDAGAQVNWPAVLPQVLAVGGTVLRAYTATSRDEAAWPGSGGGTSRTIAAPAYQAPLGRSMRTLPDVAMNAGVGQVLVQIPPATRTPSGRRVCPPTPRSAIPAPPAAASAPAGLCPPVWSAIIGTSLAAPEWAGILAVADAERSLRARGVLGEVQPLLYALLRRPALYARVFKPIDHGGLGTPNVEALLRYLRGSPQRVAPIVLPLTLHGAPFQALDFNMPLSAVAPVRWSLAHAPAGMRIGPSTGVISWPRPPCGRYVVTATATDPRTGLSGSARLRLRISSAHALTLASARGRSAG